MSEFISGSKSSPPVARRDILRYAAGAVGTLALGSSAAGCGAIGTFNPAVAGWLGELGISIGANLAADALVNGLQGMWKKWGPGVRDVLDKESQPWRYRDMWCHDGPPVVLAATSPVKASDPMRENLVACVEGGKKKVTLEPWAWQAVAMYVHELTDGKEDDELAQWRRFCALSLIPNGVAADRHETPAGTLGSISYPTINGRVEIGWAQNSDGSRYAHITATGIPDKDNQAIARRFDLPTQKA